MRSLRSVYALVVVVVALAGLSACAPTQADAGSQGWSADQQYRWHRGSQGSRLIPKDWLVALEESDGAGKFMSPARVERLGYLRPAADDESQLPIGFAVDRTDDEKLGATHLRWFDGQSPEEPWVGLNCSACHTAEITYSGKRMRIDGAPTIADFQTFQEELIAALVATSANPDKWNRFAAAVLTGRDTQANRDLLRGAFAQLVDGQQRLAKLNATDVRYGYARLDAVGHILNRVALLDGASNPYGGPPDAPVSYPFIWNTHQHDVVQWNGVAPNRPFTFQPSGETFDVGALARNTGEVIGVFADVVVSKNPNVLSGYRSSVSVKNLDSMETQLRELRSPVWPAEVLGALKQDLVATGRGLFQTQCAACHEHLDHDELDKDINAKMTPIWGNPDQHPVGTDPWMACNTFTYTAKSGNMEGVSLGFVGGDPIGPTAFTRDLLTTMIVGVFAGQKRNIATIAAQKLLGVRRKIEVTPFALEAEAEEGQLSRAARLLDCEQNKANPLMAYKGRPLNGIWATAPYMHNGSMKSLYEVLLPPAERDKSFYVGNREYDPKGVGYRDEQGAFTSLFETQDAAGQPLHGNSNAGHDYGNAALTDEQRWALVEYMKSL